jgi:endonuclease/exonuclease/phosphatase family metal-dependent hydrolase
MEALQLDFLALQETKRSIADETLRLPHGYVFYGSSTSSRSSGVGVLLSRRAVSVVKDVAVVEPDRVIKIKLEDFDVLSVYMPTRDRPAERDKLFGAVGAVLREARPAVLLGDFNADPRKQRIRDGDLQDFCDQFDLRFARHNKNTWYGTSGTTSQLDHIVVANRYASCLGACRTVTAVIPTDHRLLTCEIRFRFVARRPARKDRSTRRDYDSLAFTPKLRSCFNTSFLAAAASAAQKMDAAISEVRAVEEQLKDFLANMRAAAEAALPLVKRTKSLEAIWRDAAVAQATGDSKLRAAVALHRQQARSQLRDFSQQLAGGRAWLAWQSMRELEAKAPSLKSSTLNLDAFTEHFRKLLCPPTPPPDDPRYASLKGLLRELKKPSRGPRWLDSDFTPAELDDAIQGMANHKATGPDGVPIEVFRCPACREALLPILNGCLRTGHIPDLLLSAAQVPLFKGKGSIDDSGNYRGICLLSLVTKILNKMLLLRFRTALNDLLLPCQNAYRPERSCQEHVAALAELIDLARRTNNAPLVCLFVDFSKAFDSVDRKQLRHVLEWWGCPERLLNLLFAILDGQQLVVRYDGECSVPFTPTAGVLQGDTLAPFLFLVVMDIIFRHTDPDPQHSYGFNLRPLAPGQNAVSFGTKTRPHLPPRSNCLPLLGYADDVGILANSATAAQRMLLRLEDAAGLFGLRLNFGKGKTEALFIGDPPEGPAACIVSRNGTTVTLCTQYKYLGTLVGTSWLDDFRRRKTLAWQTIRRFSWVWQGPRSTDEEKRRLFTALVEPIVTYSVASYPWTAAVRSALDRTLQKMLRHCMAVRVAFNNLDAHRPIEELLGDAPYFSAKIAALRLQHFGHRLRQHYTAATDPSHVHHPMFDVFEAAGRGPSTGAFQLARGGALRQSAFSAVLTMLEVSNPDTKRHPPRNMDELRDVYLSGSADQQRSRWRSTVRRCLAHYQQEVAMSISSRRAREKNRTWSQSDHELLLERARRIAVEFRLRCPEDGDDQPSSRNRKRS